MKTWSDLLEDLLDHDRSVGAVEEDEEEAENATDPSDVMSSLQPSEVSDSVQEVNSKVSMDPLPQVLLFGASMLIRLLCVGGE